eukprot:Hpha_TRINITY_DN8137_c0_g1::TRINITY_DN8137_c0_g1_i2::g.172108::m.172108
MRLKLCALEHKGESCGMSLQIFTREGYRWKLLRLSPSLVVNSSDRADSPTYLPHRLDRKRRDVLVEEQDGLLRSPGFVRDHFLRRDITELRAASITLRVVLRRVRANSLFTRIARKSLSRVVLLQRHVRALLYRRRTGVDGCVRRWNRWQERQEATLRAQTTLRQALGDAAGAAAGQAELNLVCIPESEKLRFIESELESRRAAFKARLEAWEEALSGVFAYTFVFMSPEVRRVIWQVFAPRFSYALDADELVRRATVRSRTDLPPPRRSPRFNSRRNTDSGSLRRIGGSPPRGLVGLRRPSTGNLNSPLIPRPPVQDMSPTLSRLSSEPFSRRHRGLRAASNGVLTPPQHHMLPPAAGPVSGDLTYSSMTESVRTGELNDTVQSVPQQQPLAGLLRSPLCIGGTGLATPGGLIMSPSSPESPRRVILSPPEEHTSRGSLLPCPPIEPRHSVEPSSPPRLLAGGTRLTRLSGSGWAPHGGGSPLVGTQDTRDDTTEAIASAKGPSHSPQVPPTKQLSFGRRKSSKSNIAAESTPRTEADGWTTRFRPKRRSSAGVGREDSLRSLM